MQISNHHLGAKIGKKNKALGEGASADLPSSPSLPSPPLLLPQQLPLSGNLHTFPGQHPIRPVKWPTCSASGL